MGKTERTAADLTDFRRYRPAEVGRYRIGSLRQIIFVVIVLSQYLAGNCHAHPIAGTRKFAAPVVRDAIIPQIEIPLGIGALPVVVVGIHYHPALGEHSEIDILFKRTEEFGLALLRHNGNIQIS